MSGISKKDLRTDLRGRKIVKRKLESAIRSLDKAIVKIDADRAKRRETLMQYKSEAELQDAYGWGFITEEEYDALLEQFRSGTEAIDAEKSPQEIAKEILIGWLRLTYSDITSLEFDLLPEKKQDEIRERNYQIAMELEERRRKRETAREAGTSTGGQE